MMGWLWEVKQRGKGIHLNLPSLPAFLLEPPHKEGPILSWPASGEFATCRTPWFDTHPFKQMLHPLAIQVASLLLGGQPCTAPAHASRCCTCLHSKQQIHHLEAWSPLQPAKAPLPPVLQDLKGNPTNEWVTCSGLLILQAERETAVAGCCSWEQGSPAGWLVGIGLKNQGIRNHLKRIYWAGSNQLFYC